MLKLKVIKNLKEKGKEMVKNLKGNLTNYEYSVVMVLVGLNVGVLVTCIKAFLYVGGRYSFTMPDLISYILAYLIGFSFLIGYGRNKKFLTGKFDEWQYGVFSFIKAMVNLAIISIWFSLSQAYGIPFSILALIIAMGLALFSFRGIKNALKLS